MSPAGAGPAVAVERTYGSSIIVSSQDWTGFGRKLLNQTRPGGVEPTRLNTPGALLKFWPKISGYLEPRSHIAAAGDSNFLDLLVHLFVLCERNCAEALSPQWLGACQ